MPQIQRIGNQTDKHNGLEAQQFGGIEAVLRLQGFARVNQAADRRTAQQSFDITFTGQHAVRKQQHGGNHRHHRPADQRRAEAVVVLRGRNKGEKCADQQLVCAHIRQEIRVHAEGGQKDGQQAQYNQQKDELADAASFAEVEKGNQQNRKNKVKLLFQR